MVDALFHVLGRGSNPIGDATGNQGTCSNCRCFFVAVVMEIAARNERNGPLLLEGPACFFLFCIRLLCLQRPFLKAGAGRTVGLGRFGHAFHAG